MFDQNILVRVEEAFAEKRRAADELAELHRREAERKIPELKEINAALGDFTLRVLHASLKGGDVAARVNELRRENRQLRKTRDDLLEAAGFPRDYLQPKRSCPLCEDVGYAGGSLCSCMKKAIMAENAKASGIARLLERQNFETFSLDYYSDALLPGKTYSARDEMRNILNRCRAYAEDFSDQSPSLLFIGGTGLGKTHLSSAIAKVLLENGFDVLYETVPNVIAAFEKERFLSEEESVRTARFQEADLLILDDLGTEPQGKSANSVIYNLINSRTLVAGKPTIISTNLSYRQLEAQYDAPTTSRLFGDFDVYVFQGSDVRRARADS